MSRFPALVAGLLFAAALPPVATSQVAPPLPTGRPPVSAAAHPAVRPAAPPAAHPPVRTAARPPAPAVAHPAPNSLGADWREQQEEARQGVRRGRMAPLAQVLDQIRRRSPGRQLDAGIEYQGERPVYRVRWVTTGGRRIDYIVDGATGAILSGG